MLNLFLFIVYASITVILIILVFYSQYKWIPLTLGVLMGSVSVVVFILPPMPLPNNYWNWATYVFWVLLAVSIAFGISFSLDVTKWWAGLITGCCLSILSMVTLVDIILYHIFPLLPGASVSVISLISVFSVGGIGIVMGKSMADKKNGFCIPFLEDCSKYDCEDLGKCQKY